MQIGVAAAHPVHRTLVQHEYMCTQKFVPLHSSPSTVYILQHMTSTDNVTATPTKKRVVCTLDGYYYFYYYGQVSELQSATLLPISCKSVQPVPARVEEPVSPVRQSSSGGATNNPPFPKMS